MNNEWAGGPAHFLHLDWAISPPRPPPVTVVAQFLYFCLFPFIYVLAYLGEWTTTTLPHTTERTGALPLVVAGRTEAAAYTQTHPNVTQ